MTKLEQVAIAIQDEARAMSIVVSDGAAIRLARAAVKALMGEVNIDFWDSSLDEILNEPASDAS